MNDYKTLKCEFDQKVKKLQDSCPHTDTHWADHWWAIGHFSGYKVLICNNCQKTLREDPTAEQRDAAKQEWLKEYFKK